MLWQTCLTLSVLTLIISILLACKNTKNYKSGRIFTPFNIIFTGAFLTIYIALLPIFIIDLNNESANIAKIFLFDFIQTIQVFTINTGTSFILENINSTSISGIYSLYVSILFLVAPLLTFSFLISLFKERLSHLTYKFCYFKDVYIFSQLNEKTLLLSTSIKKNQNKATIIFTDINQEMISDELIEGAKELKAILIKEDILTVQFKMHSKKAKISFLIISDNENDNIILSLKLLEKYNQRENTELYVFSTSTQGEMLLSSAHKGTIKVRRINEIRSLVYNFLYHEGYRLFETANTNNNKKEINAIIIGLGQYGKEFLKALTWYCQMDSYAINIDAFDKDEQAAEKFSALCPELMSDQYNGTCIPGESEYTITIHSNIDVSTQTFQQEISKLNKTTIAFICLGNDSDNINQAANMRMLLERTGCTPIIKTIIYNTEVKEAMQDITNYRGQPYNIEGMGDFTSIYSHEILLASKLEKLALQRHLKWGSEEEFWQYEYNYLSSMASALHLEARIQCQVQNEDDIEKIEQLEHRRWNTYMRTIGYIYSGSPNKESRNDLAKMHHNLVPFKKLSEEDIIKDKNVGTK